MALGEATPVFAARFEPVFSERRWELLTGNQGVEDVLKRFGVEFGVLASVPEIELETREND